jgi:hypothetical protein
MDIQKHGGIINLPQHLHENLSKTHQQLLTTKYIEGLTSSAESMRNGPAGQMINPATGSIGQRGMKRMGKRASISLEASSQSPKVLIQDQSGANIMGRQTSVSLKPPGLGWISRLVNYSSQNRLHWISPSRDIEFKRRPHACQFEKMRKRYGNDEKKAWKVYREKFRQTFVVDAHKYDS